MHSSFFDECTANILVKTQLCTHLVKFSCQQPQKYTDNEPNSVPKGILNNVSQTQNVSDPPPTAPTNRESPSWAKILRHKSKNAKKHCRHYQVWSTYINQSLAKGPSISPKSMKNTLSSDNFQALFGQESRLTSLR